ncbi:MAG: xanthine phosphoribosyltransferase [Monoglobales bacterium]
MQSLKDRILSDGKVRPGNVLKVDSFLNHQMDIHILEEIGAEFKRRFEDANINKILTIEASGIAIACMVAKSFDVPLVFAKKNQTKNIAGDVYSSRVTSYTHSRVYDVIVSKEFLTADDRVLLIDDFLANGCALEGLIDIVDQSGAMLEGIGIVIEKHFQGGGDRLREKGIRLESLAIIESMTDDSLKFKD